MFRWKQGGFYGGNSGDQFVGIPFGFQSGKNIEIRKNPRFITLNKRPVRNSSGVFADFVMKFLTIQSTGDVIAFGDTGKIYRQTAGSGNFVLVYTDTSNRKIVNAIEFNGYLYWATSAYLHRISVSNIDASWSGDVTENYKTFTNGNATFHPMLEVYNILNIGDGKNVAQLDSVGTFTGSKLPIFGDEQVVGITFNGGTMKVYAQNTTSVERSRMYIWDGVSSNYQEATEWNGKTIHAIASDGIDYALAGRMPGLYAVNGYDKQTLLQLPNFADGDSATFSPNCMTMQNDLVLFGAVASGTNSFNRGVWSFGARDKNYPRVLNNDFSTSNGSSSDVVGAVHYSNGKVYFSWKNGSTYGVDVTDNTLYAATGEIVSRSWDAGAPDLIKEIKNGKLVFKQLAAGEKLELYLRRDLVSSWGSAIITVDYDNDSSDREICFKELPTNAVGEPFQFLEFKVVLTAGTSGATTPSLIDVIIEADFIKVH